MQFVPRQPALDLVLAAKDQRICAGPWFHEKISRKVDPRIGEKAFRPGTFSPSISRRSPLSPRTPQ